MLLKKIFYLKIIQAEKKIFSGLVKKINLKTEQGTLEIFPNHAPLLALIKAGIVKIENEQGKKLNIQISDGILEINPEIVVILTKNLI